MKLAGRLLLLFISSVILGIGLQLYKRGCIYMDDENRLSDFSDIGRVFITGANTGIGLETARGLLRRGINVILGCRDVDKCKNARDILLEEKVKYEIGEIDLETIDLASLESVRDCAHRLKSKYTDLRVLVNNAGFMGSPLKYTAQDVELHIAVNHLAHFLLTNLLLDHMKSNLPPLTSLTSNAYKPVVRVINLASNLHAWTYNGFNLTHPGLTQAYTLTTEYNDKFSSHKVYHHPVDAYSQSKLANVLFARQLAKQEKENNNVISVSLHPGVIATELMRHHNSIIQVSLSN
jgi:NAD(P)-dependent dehydrogenase (short-subunit alcohol dehydrogenase family)